MTKVFVAVTEAAKGGGAKVGSTRRDIGIEVPDRSYESMREAEAKAVAQYASEQGIKPDRVYVVGVY